MNDNDEIICILKKMSNLSSNSLTSSMQVLQNQEPIIYTSLMPKKSNETTDSITSSSSSDSFLSSFNSLLENIDTTTVLYAAGGVLVLYLVLRE